MDVRSFGFIQVTVQSKNSKKKYAQLDGSRIIQTYITAIR